MPAPADRVQAVFLAAAELPNAADREALLDRECAGDPELRQRVETLLRAHDEPGDLLGVPVEIPSDATAALEPAVEAPDRSSVSLGEAVGTLIAQGRYKLLEAIGEGGMGT